MRKYVTYAEKAYLQIVARRIMRAREEAEAQGRVWNRVNREHTLESGITVRLEFFRGDRPRQELHVTAPQLTAEEVELLAEELLGGPPDSVQADPAGLYVFTKKESL